MLEGPETRTVVEFARAALAQSGGALADAAHVVTKAPSDPVDEVHELRIAIRRVRADLRVFEPVFDPSWIADAKAALRELARISGQSRDLDVVVDRLRPLVSTLPDCDRPAGDALLKRLEQERRHAFGQVLGALAAGAAGVETRATLLASGPVATHVSHVSLDDLVVATRRQWRRLRAAVRAVADTPSDDGLHRVRIRAKTLRYSLDTMAPVLHGSARRHAKALAALQDHLGELHDATVAESWLRTQRTHTGDAFVRGQLLGLERAQREQLRQTWRQSWERASQRRLRRWAK